ncbi:MAG: hypothetical protein ACLQOO_13780, partial [Terriglobia bacterium]
RARRSCEETKRRGAKTQRKRGKVNMRCRLFPDVSHFSLCLCVSVSKAPLQLFHAFEGEKRARFEVSFGYQIVPNFTTFDQKRAANGLQHGRKGRRKERAVRRTLSFLCRAPGVKDADSD